MHSSPSSGLRVLTLLSAVSANPIILPRSSATSISPPATRPTNAYNVPADFVGFGFAAAQLNQYDNEFSQNLIYSVADRMSLPPIIRVGGTDGDTITVNSSQPTKLTCTGQGCPTSSHVNYTVGPSYFDGFKAFPRAKMSFQAPFQPNDINDSVAYATYAYKALGSDRLAAIAIGNEPNISPDNVDNVKTYVNEALGIQSAVIKALGLTGSAQRIFEVPDLASHYTNSELPWALPDAFENGLNSNGNIKTAAEHYYQVGSGEPGGTYGGAPGSNFQVQIMDHKSIINHFVPYLDSIQYLNGTIPYVLSETGSSLVGNISYTNSFGDTLWKVDFQLYAMSHGVARVDGSQRPTVGHQLWMPFNDTAADSPIGVRATYYAQPFIADFIGNSSNTWVAELDLGSASDFFSGYAAYNGDTLARVALVNLHQWDPSISSTRPLKEVTLTLPSGVSSVKVEKLNAALGSAALGYDLGGSSNTITWAGETWSYAQDKGKGHTVGKSSTTINASGGNVVVPVADSQAVIVYI